MMYTMDLRHKPMRGLRAIGVVLGIVGMVALMTLMAGALSRVTPYASYIAFGAVFLLAYFVYKRFIVEYRYRLDKGGFLWIERLAGDRTRPLAQLNLAVAAYYGSAEGAPQAEKTQKYTIEGHANEQRLLIVQSCAYVLQPDAQLDALLAERSGKPAPEPDEGADADGQEES